ncbi:MAG: aldehyde dehydrogenase family protein [Actinobacteria bacterium]|nr:aldehyde dehydrogenase family protein [Actinomycetota bacterium]MBU1492978.1 aldehyde dehydrogenase family protein [Actinomycetota bacterium]
MSEDTMNFDMYVHGEWRPGSTGEVVEVMNPAKGELLGTVPDGGQDDLDAAVESAREGLAVWRETHPRVRSQVLYRIAATLQERAEEFARIYSLNSGGSIGTGLWTMYDVAGRRFEYYAGLADKIRGDSFVTPGEFLSYTLREPIGVTGHIVPWNGPLWIGSRTIAPALAAGNAVVVKPSSEAPLTLLKFAEMAHECGLPPGVLNVVTGRGSRLGDLFSRHPGFDGIYFTGSTATGRKILQNAATRNVRTVMELGGKSPNIVFEDADIDKALDGAILAIFANSGQICVAGSRLLVQASIHDEFVERLVEKAAGITIGGPEANALMGPVITAAQRERVLGYIEKGKQEAELVAGGGVPDDPALQKGYFVSPTIFDGVPNTAAIAREEIFGPVLSVTSFADFDEGIALANDSEYGLASAVWTENVKTANLAAQALEAGQVFINHYYTAAFEVSRSPYKSSGHGMSEGPDAIYEFLNQKSVSIKLGEGGGW